MTKASDKPKTKTKYTLEELLAQCTPENRHEEGEVERLYGHRKHTTDFSSGEDLAEKAKASFRARGAGNSGMDKNYEDVGLDVQGTQVERLQQSVKDLARERDYFEQLANEYYDKWKVGKPMNVKIKRLTDDVPTPSYAHAYDSGFDLVAAEDVVVEPGETVKVPTGLAFEIPQGYEMQIRPRSGITSKTKLRVQIGTIDAGYRGEVSVMVDNESREFVRIFAKNGDLERVIPSTQALSFAKTIDEDYVELDKITHDGTYLIRKGDRIGQAVIAPVVQAQFEVVDELGDTSRGDGGFGSSGVKTKEAE